MLVVMGGGGRTEGWLWLEGDGRGMGGWGWD